jgi:L-cystine transport system permease protein
MNDISSFLTLAGQIAQKLPITILMLVLSLFFGLIIGLLLAIVRIHKKPIPYAIATFFISFMRSTPVLVQLFVVYYGLPLLMQQFGININDWNRLLFAIITFSLNMSAFFSEMIRSAYLAVGKGQEEAAYSIGMSYPQVLRRIILPQAFVISLPNLTGNIIYLLKESALAFSIGIVDVMGQADRILANSYGTNFFQVYAIIAIFYWIMSIVIQKTGSYIEQRVKRRHGGLVR